MTELQMMTEKECAALLKVCPISLRQWRRAVPRKGPPFVRIERSIRYPVLAVERWVAKGMFAGTAVQS